MKCKVCNTDTTPIFKAKILNKYEVQYYQCKQCLFIQTEKEYWLQEAYQSSMNLSDTGVISRNIILAIKTSLILSLLFKRKGKFIDYAGGWGIFTRVMRDIGFDFYWYDPYTTNNIAKGFEANLNDKFEALTILEAFEHFQKPHTDLKKIFKLSDTIIFSTTLVPKPTPEPKTWWYYGLEHGQHISLYSEETFKYIAKTYGYYYYTDGKYFHMFTKKYIQNLFFKIITSPAGLFFLPFVFLRNKSKTIIDHNALENEK